MKSQNSQGAMHMKKEEWNCNICFNNGLGKSKMKRKA